MNVDHLGIAVIDIDEALTLYHMLGAQVLQRGQLPSFGVDVCLLDTGNAKLELIAPLGPGAVQTFLDKRGPGLHHVAFAVPDIDRELARLRQKGLALIDQRPRPGFGGHLVAFVHPKSTMGTLIELVQQAQTA